MKNLCEAVKDKTGLPDKIKELTAGRQFSVDEIGMSTSQVICFDDMVLKIEQSCEESDNEHRMTAWLEGKLPVPKILHSEKKDGVNYLLMSKITGDMACEEQLMDHPEELLKYLADGLKMLWNVPIADCPCRNDLERKLRLAEIRVENDLCDMEDAEEDTYGEDGFSDPGELLQWLKEHRPQEELVFSHGDYCLPNIFIKDGKVNGFIDLGRSGAADKYQDIALCYRSLFQNYSGKYAQKMYKDFSPERLFAELGIEPDWEKIRYYILLDELF